MKGTKHYSSKVRHRAVGLVQDQQIEHGSLWAAIKPVASERGCTAKTLRRLVRQSQRDQGIRAGPTSAESERITALKREHRELRQANEILRKALAYFTQAEFNRRFKS